MRRAAALVPVPASTIQALTAAIDALRADLAEQRADVTAIRQVLERRGPRRYDEAGDRAWVTAIAGLQGRVFSVAELIEHARVDERLSAVLAGLSPRQIGKRLRALAGRNIAGFVVQRIGRDDRGSLWSMAAASDH